MSSFDQGKEMMVGWIKGRMRKGATCLDVGACDGKWSGLLDGYLTMDAVEIFQPYIEQFGLEEKYRHVYNKDISDFEYDHYDLIIFGDVLEHMEVDKAQKVLDYAKGHYNEIVIAVPFLFRQWSLNRNQWEEHKQEDLTPELFKERYPGFQMIHRPLPNYAYYVLEG